MKKYMGYIKFLISEVQVIVQAANEDEARKEIEKMADGVEYDFVGEITDPMILCI